MIINGSIAEFYHQDFHGKLFVAVEDFCYTICEGKKVVLKMPAESKYINSGLILFNLKKMRVVLNDERILRYDEGKRAAESLMFDYHRQHGVDIRIVRIFNTYGPRMNPYDGRVVSNFIVQALKGENLTVYGDGTQTRSFCYVDDLIDGIIRMMNCEDFTGPVNLAKEKLDWEPRVMLDEGLEKTIAYFRSWGFT